MEFFSHLSDWLQHGRNVILLYVLQSQGSSPGRQGFHMAISSSGEMIGSIGGGIMEHKLVELARQAFKKNESKILFKHQIHSKVVAKNQSGMICSGEQSIAIIPITKERKKTILEITAALQKGSKGYLTITPTDFSFSSKEKNNFTFHYDFESPQNWTYQEKIGFKKFAYIIGGGHVGAALSQVLKLLDFHITIFDNRPQLNTLEQNQFAHQKKVISYSEIQQHIPEGAAQFIFIMTFGYRTDLEVLQQLVHKKVKYIGMMGSENKIRQLLNEMTTLGYTSAQLAHVHTPIGMPIKSRTPHEIAISIAAQIIQFQNQDLP